MLNFENLVRYEGNEALFRAVEMSTLSTLAGTPFHLHAHGVRGTGKTTILRAARGALPKIERIRGCVYNCDPRVPHCPIHSSMGRSEIKHLGTELIQMPFLEISHSAKVGTVVGSIDMTKLMDANRPHAALLPGTIAQAHRGIILVDEINRLVETSPELADVLLSVMGTKPGRLQIEEIGLPLVEMKIQASVWAASNPDEEPGSLEDIRKQLSDRFDFSVRMSRPSNPDTILKILQVGGLSGAESGMARNMPSDYGKRFTIWDGAVYISRVVPRYIDEIIASLYVDFSIESLRAVETLRHGCALSALINGRPQANLEDLISIAPLALYHRVDLSTLNQILKCLSEHTKRIIPSEDLANPNAKGLSTPSTGEASGHSVQQYDVQPRYQPGNTGALEKLIAKIKDGIIGNQISGAHSSRGQALTSKNHNQGGVQSDRFGGTETNKLNTQSAINPESIPPFAPPARARLLSELTPANMVKTQEDLLK